MLQVYVHECAGSVSVSPFVLREVLRAGVGCVRVMCAQPEAEPSPEQTVPQPRVSHSRPGRGQGTGGTRPNAHHLHSLRVCVGGRPVLPTCLSPAACGLAPDLHAPPRLSSSTEQSTSSRLIRKHKRRRRKQRLRQTDRVGGSQALGGVCPSEAPTCTPSLVPLHRPLPLAASRTLLCP